MSQDHPVYIMESFSRSGETLLLRALAAHPKIHVIHDLRRSNTEQEISLFSLIKDTGISSIPVDHPLLEGQGLSPDTVLVLKNATWTHSFPHSGFVLARNPFSIILSTGAFDYTPGKEWKYSGHIQRWAKGIDPLMYDYLVTATPWEAMALLYAKKMSVISDGFPIVNYENFVANPEPQLRRIISHMGLEWDEKVLRSHEFYSEGEVGHGRIKLWIPIHSGSSSKYLEIDEERFWQIYCLTIAVLPRLGYQVNSKREIELQTT